MPNRFVIEFEMMAMVKLLFATLRTAPRVDSVDKKVRVVAKLFRQRMWLSGLKSKFQNNPKP
jgi:hypothetical protein